MSHTDAKLHRLLMDQSDRDPYALAYGSVRYGALAVRAARLAGTLREAGVRWGDCVAVALDGCAEYLVAYYGTLMAGATVVPVSPEIRGGSLQRVLDHCGATAVVGPGPVLERLARHGRVPTRLRVAIHVGAPTRRLAPHVESVDFAVAEATGREIFDTGAQGSALACVSYTSGTSGVPK